MNISPKNHNRQKGFSLIEVLVALSIGVIIMTAFIGLGSYSGSQSAVTNAAYDVALLIREAQARSVGTVGDAAGADFTSGYGVYITTTSSKVLLFRDSNSNDAYDTNETVVSTISIRNGTLWKQICGIPSGGGSQICNTTFSIVFHRPNTDAVMKLSGTSLSLVNIQIQNTSGVYRTIEANVVGYISVIDDTLN